MKELTDLCSDILSMTLNDRHGDLNNDSYLFQGNLLGENRFSISDD